MKRHEMKTDRETRTPEDLRRVLGKIYPEEIVDDLMSRLGFEDDRQISRAEEENCRYHGFYDDKQESGLLEE